MDLKEKFFAEYLHYLTPEQWVDLLGTDHSLWEYCSCRDEFNGRDWRKLLQCDFEFFADKCNYQKLDTGEWYQLFMDKNLDYKKLLKFCPAVDFDGYQWYKLILARPELEPICDWGKLDRLAWHVILLNYPQLAKHCTFGALPEDDWQELIAKKTELAKYKPENAQQKGKIMGYSTETSSQTQKCMTCQYWQGKRKIRFCTSSDVRVQYDNDSSNCTAWNQSRNGNFVCNRYKRWLDLP